MGVGLSPYAAGDGMAMSRLIQAARINEKFQAGQEITIVRTGGIDGKETVLCTFTLDKKVDAKRIEVWAMAEIEEEITELAILLKGDV